MKKLIIMAAILVAGVAANAASFNWSTTGTIYSPGSDSVAINGFTAYLFDASAVSQATLVEALRSGSDIVSQTFLASTTQEGAKIASTAIDASVTGAVNMYFAIVQDDNVYISNMKSVTAQATATTALAFASQSTNSKNTFDSTTAYSSAGWYSTAAAVPEPTSGLLMLLGMAGLALRRRRA